MSYQRNKNHSQAKQDRKLRQTKSVDKNQEVQITLLRSRLEDLDSQLGEALHPRLPFDLYSINSRIEDLEFNAENNNGVEYRVEILNNRLDTFETTADLRLLDLEFSVEQSSKSNIDITNLENEIITLENSIITLNSDVSSLDSQVTINEGAIFNLQTNVSSNDLDISNLQNRVTTNESNIATNTSDIATNASDILTNSAAILALQDDFNFENNDYTHLR